MMFHGQAHKSFRNALGRHAVLFIMFHFLHRTDFIRIQFGVYGVFYPSGCKLRLNVSGQYGGNADSRSAKFVSKRHHETVD